MNKKIKEKKRVRMKNKALCKRYPFLIIRDWKDNPIEEEYTYLDDMPIGWRRAFGIQMCEEIRQALVKKNRLYTYRIEQIKEKFGGLRWYAYGGTPEIDRIIDKYEDISYRTCVCCGRPATKISLGWISPFCDKCAEKLSNRVQFKEID